MRWPFSTKPSEITADGDQATIDGCDGLPLFPAQVILEVGHVPDGDPLDGERLPIGMAEPTGELSQVVSDRPASVGGQVMGGEVGRPTSPFSSGPTDRPPKTLSPEFWLPSWTEI